MDEGYRSNSSIKKDIRVGEGEISAVYDPQSGLFSFGKKVASAPLTSTQTNLGAFKTITSLVNAFKDLNPRKIRYRIGGDSPEEVKVKDKLYSRVLRRLGYTETRTFSREIAQSFMGGWQGPDRLWVNKKIPLTYHNATGLEKSSMVTSLVGILAGLFFLSPTLTGKVIANSTTPTTSVIGVCLLVIGLLIGFFIFRKR